MKKTPCGFVRHLRVHYAVQVTRTMIEFFIIIWHAIWERWMPDHLCSSPFRMRLHRWCLEYSWPAWEIYLPWKIKFNNQSRTTNSLKSFFSSSFSLSLSDMPWLSHMPWTTFIGARRRTWIDIDFRGLLLYRPVRGRVREVLHGFRGERLSLTVDAGSVVCHWVGLDDGCARLSLAMMGSAST